MILSSVGCLVLLGLNSVDVIYSTTSDVSNNVGKYGHNQSTLKLCTTHIRACEACSGAHLSAPSTNETILGHPTRTCVAPDVDQDTTCT